MSSQREEAFAAHQRGDLAAAEPLYRELTLTALLEDLGSALGTADAPEIPPGVLNYLEVDEVTIAAIARRHAQTLAEAFAAMATPTRSTPITRSYLSAIQT